MTLYLPEVENDYVLEFYNKIAKHFQQTRVYLWPCVKDFLERTDKNDIIGDIGCGSGRYLSYPRNIIGCDLCNNLLQLCNQKDVLVCDAVRLPYRDNCFDKIMCIAMLHHISSLERRKEIVKECLRILKPGGVGIFTVWAYEQGHNLIRRHNLLEQFSPGGVLRNMSWPPALLVACLVLLQ